MGHVVADDDDPVDVGYPALADGPRQIHDMAAVRQRSPDHLRPHLGIDVAVVAVERGHLLARGIPGTLVEHRHRVGAPGKRIEGPEFLGAEPPVPADLEPRHPILGTFFDCERQNRLLRPRLGQQGVIGHPEVDEAPAGIVLREAAADVVVEALLGEAAAAEPPEALGLDGHRPHNLVVGQRLVALDAHLADRNAAAFGHIKDHPHSARRIHRLHPRRHSRGVEALVPVQRINRGLALRHRRPVERPALQQLHLPADVTRGQLFRTRNRPGSEHRALHHPEHHDVACIHDALLHDDIVELSRSEKRLNGPLNVAVGRELAGSEPAGTQHRR